MMQGTAYGPSLQSYCAPVLCLHPETYSSTYHCWPVTMPMTPLSPPVPIDNVSSNSCCWVPNVYYILSCVLSPLMVCVTCTQLITTPPAAAALMQCHVLHVNSTTTLTHRLYSCVCMYTTTKMSCMCWMCTVQPLSWSYSCVRIHVHVHVHDHQPCHVLNMHSTATIYHDGDLFSYTDLCRLRK